MIGYDAAAEVMKQAKREHKSIKEVVLERGLLTAEAFDALLAKGLSD